MSAIAAEELRLVSMYSHNIRTSLTVVKGYLDMVSDGDITIDPDTAAKLVDKINIGLLHIAQMETLLRATIRENRAIRTTVWAQRRGLDQRTKRIREQLEQIDEQT